MNTDSPILTKASPPREIFKEFTYNGATLTFSKMPDDPIWFAKTQVGYYEIERSGSTYSVLLPWDEVPNCGFDNLNDAMEECVKQHILATNDY